MHIWEIWRWLRGVVVFRAEGGLCERFLSLLCALDPPLDMWDIRRESTAVTVSCRASDYRRLRHVARRTGTRVRSVRHYGLPFSAKPLIRRPGIVIGTALAVVLYMLLSSRIWLVDVQTEDPALVARIEAVLADHGVGIGLPMKEVDIPSLRMQAIAQIQEINQLSLYFDGSIARVGVQLQKPGASPPDTHPCHIYAAQDGRIVSLRATVGQPTVMEGEAVLQGDLLVSGITQTAQGPLFHHATAVVLAETTRTFEECITLTESVPCDGRIIEQPSLTILSWTLPLYSPFTPDGTWTVSEHERFLSLFGTSLPIGITSTRYTEQTQTTVTYTREQAEALARERLETRARTVLKEAQIDRVRWNGVWEGERYCLRAVYRCTEDIAKEIPLLSP